MKKLGIEEKFQYALCDQLSEEDLNLMNQAENNGVCWELDESCLRAHNLDLCFLFYL